MSHYYQYSDEELQAFKTKQKFNSILRQYTWHRSRFNRGLYATCVTPEDLAGIKITCNLLYRDLLELDRERCLKEVPDLA